MKAADLSQTSASVYKYTLCDITQCKEDVSKGFTVTTYGLKHKYTMSRIRANSSETSVNIYKYVRRDNTKHITVSKEPAVSIIMK